MTDESDLQQVVKDIPKSLKGKDEVLKHMPEWARILEQDEGWVPLDINYFGVVKSERNGARVGGHVSVCDCCESKFVESLPDPFADVVRVPPIFLPEKEIIGSQPEPVPAPESYRFSQAEQDYMAHLFLTFARIDKLKADNERRKKEIEENDRSIKRLFNKIRREGRQVLRRLKETDNNYRDLGASSSSGPSQNEK